MSPNRLASETSPYLLQHAHNPVDWFPWGDEAFALAGERNVPVLLSVGYAACHWCHVMAHESFEDEATAAEMNENFVCIKVDREERPDVDSIYMDAVQAMTGSGGWPMTVFLTPTGQPFYAGTYFPPQPRHGMPSFGQVLAGISKAWSEDRGSVVAQAAKVTDAIAGMRPAGAGADLSEEVLRNAHTSLRQAFDPEWGGWGGAPKFPQPMAIDFCLRADLRGWSGALDMARASLDAMANGGIYDQIGGGFHRYSTDHRWLVPHFEKMLYDNAQLAHTYTRAFQVTRDDRYRQIARETLDYLLREMRHPDGGFYSSQDADSEGVEGKFFVWSWEELATVVGEPVALWYGASPTGNWEGTNVLWTPRSLEAVAGEAGISSRQLGADIGTGRARLFAQREQRIRPGTDDKIIAAWNGLAIRSLAVAGRALDEPAYLQAAREAASFVLERMRVDGRLQRSWRQGRVSGPGFSDDYALMVSALLALYEATGTSRWISEARALMDGMMDLFSDPEGGFFQTGLDAGGLVLRPKEVFDNAVPSGNSSAAHALLRLSMLTGETRYEDAAISAMLPLTDHMSRAPVGFAESLCALDLLLARGREVAIIGEPATDPTLELAEEVWSRFLPHTVLAIGDPSETPAVELLAGRSLVAGLPAAYVCENFACQMPVTDRLSLAQLL